MIIVAIIGILASVSISAYKNYVARSSHTAGFVEIRLGKVTLETSLNMGDSINTPEAINLLPQTKNCSEITATSNAGSGSITCKLIGTSVIHDKVITLRRDNTGFWSCNSTASSIYSGKCTGI